MGKAISTLLGGETKQEVKEQLTFLVKSCTEKLDRYQEELESAFADKSEIQRRSVPGNRAIRWVREYSVGVSSKTSDEVNGAVNSFFSIADAKDSNDRKAKAVDGFKKVVTAALNTFLGNNQAGEHEEQKFFIFLQHNAVIRIDVRLWRYNFTSNGVMANAENALCYIICSSVVNREDLFFDEILYLLSEHAGDDDVEAYIDELARVWHKMETLPIRFRSGRDGQIGQQNIPMVTTVSVPRMIREASAASAEPEGGAANNTTNTSGPDKPIHGRSIVAVPGPLAPHGPK